MAKTLTLFIATAVLGLLAQEPKGLTTKAVETREVKGLNLNQVTTVNALTSALSSAHVPGGVITIATCDVDDSYDLRPLGPTLSDALDSIVTANPRYRWYVEKGAVNLVPSNNEPTLLDVSITNFNVERGNTIDDIVGKLLALPEVRVEAVRLNLTQGFTEIGLRSLERPGSIAREDNKDFTLQLQNITVRDALNTIARTHGSAVWSYQEKRCQGAKEFSIRFLVQ